MSATGKAPIMTESIILLVFLILLLCICKDRLKYKIYHPTILVLVPFILSILCGLLNYANWGYKLHWITVFVVGGGLLTFVVVSQLATFIVKKCCKKRGQYMQRRGTSLRLFDDGPAYRIICLAGIAFSMVTAVLLFLKVREIVFNNGIEATGITVLSEYDRLSKFSGVDVSSRGMIGQLATAANALSYIWGYLFLKSIMSNHRKMAWGYGFNLLCSACIPLLTGARAGLICLVISLTAMSLILFDQEKKVISKKAKMTICFFCVFGLIGLLICFKPIVQAMGRNTGDVDSFEYVSTYLGGSIMNLDMYLSDTEANPIEARPEKWGEQTFAVLYESFAHWSGNDAVKKWNEWQPFQEANGHDLGNVYTVFYTFIFDWGIAGSFIAIGVVSFVSTVLYCSATSDGASMGSFISLPIVVYSFVSYGLVFCFFHNFIVTTTVSSGFIRYLIVWAFVVYAPCVVSLAIDKLRPSHVLR